MDLQNLFKRSVSKKILTCKTFWIVQLTVALLILNISPGIAGNISVNSTAAGSLLPQQQKTISGKVVDQNSKPLPGVSVTVKGTTIGVVTDGNGDFSLTVPGNSKTLSFSFVGLLAKDVEIGNQSVLRIAMEESAVGLDEVIVIGYGTVKKSHLTGAISKVNNEGLEQIPTSRPEEALVGKVSGVNIQMVDASAGGAPTIRVRGIGSITADASPLIVMDGVVVSADYLTTIDMNDVESVEV